MKCRACRGAMRPSSKPFVPVVVPILLALGGVGGGGYLFATKMAQLQVAGAIALVCAVGGVLLASMQRVGLVCASCGASAVMSADEEKKLAADERSSDIEKMRDQLASKLRPQIE